MSTPDYEDDQSDCNGGRPVVRFEYLRPQLELIRSDIGVGSYKAQLPEPNELGHYWAGADVVITNQPQAIERWNFVVTPFAAEVGWFYTRIFEVAYKARLIDYFSKYEFAGRLAECVRDFHLAQMPRRKTRKALLLAMLQRVTDVAVKFDLHGDAMNPE